MIITGLVLGALLGIVMQRGRFCVTGMLRDVFLQRSWRTFTALLIVISVHAVGLTALISTGVINPDYRTLAPAAVIVGGFVFGLGIILAGGCASGTWYRAGEGLVGSWIALAMYALSATAMKGGMLNGFSKWMGGWETELTTIPAALGVSPWWFTIGLSALTFAMARHYMAKSARSPKPATLGHRAAWKRPINVYTAAVLVGLLGVIAWPLSTAAGRNDGLGITSPSSNLIKYIATGAPERLDWGVMLILGILLGSVIAAKATGEFRVRVPDSTTAVRSLVGGVMMGVGASLAGGCTVGNGMVQTSLFSFQGWIALLFIAAGVGVGTRIWLKPSAAQAGRNTSSADQTYTTGQSLDNLVGVSGDDVAPAHGGNTQAPTGNVFGGFAAAPSAVMLKELDITPSNKLKDLGEGRYALDSLGAVCPFPLIEAKDVMKTLRSGDHLVIDFDCTQATEAIPDWAARDGHEVTDFHQKGDASWQITLRKG